MQVLWGVGGMVVLLAIAFLLSNNRRAINPRTVFVALASQFLLGVIVLYWGAGKRALEAASGAVQAVIDATKSELFTMMGTGLATVAGSLLVGYSLLGVRLDYLMNATIA